MTPAPPPLPPEQLHRDCPLESLPFASTEELPDLEGSIGQERALEAIRFGTGIRRDGYNLFVVGAPGLGRHTLVLSYLEGLAAGMPAAPDWCYVNNFQEPHRPRALRLPTGRGRRFEQDVKQLVEDLRSAIPAAFESEHYRARLQELEDSLKERQAERFGKLGQEAGEADIAFMHTPTGFAFAPVRDGEVIAPAEYEKLPEAERNRVEETISGLQERLKRLLRQLPQWQRETRRKVKELNREVTHAAVAHLVAELRSAYADLAEVCAYLDAVEQDVIDNADDFRKPAEEEHGAPLGSPGGAPPFRRYRVNLLVDHDDAKGAPVVTEDNPSLQNLVGRAEHLSQMGALLTDFTLIKAGALHTANGGFLLLDARKVLLAPFAWDGLKRALSAGRVRIESVGEMLSLVSTITLEPQAIPLDLKVVLVGEPLLYYLLRFYDADFADLFKVLVDFDDRAEYTPETLLLFARLVATLARRENLRHFDRPAVARVIEYSSRLIEDSERLSVHMRALADLVRESDYWAAEAGRTSVTRTDVERAIQARTRRLDRLRERVHESIARGTVMIDTRGTQVGQVNGLSVIDLGDFAFGQPSRITATARLGDGKVVDIEREVELGGALHSKGVLILSHFLAARYARDRPLTFSASLAFEQSYGPVEGDSASLAELCALLSALAGLPVRQALAVTGSVNQHGQVQPIGGVNEKVEGFFDVCRVRGLGGGQGVLIPAGNIPHLMLRSEVVEAARAGAFQVYAVAAVDEALELLTGLPAGAPDAAGQYPEDSVNGRVQSRLMELTNLAQAYAQMFRGNGNDDAD